MYTENILDRAVNTVRLTDQSDREIKRIAHIYDISVPVLKRAVSDRKIRYFKAKLISKAQKKHRKIYPCVDKNSLDECFTIHKDELLLWYNTSDTSTHIQRMKI